MEEYVEFESESGMNSELKTVIDESWLELGTDGSGGGQRDGRLRSDS